MSTEAARIQMVNQQVRAWDVLDPAVLRVLTEVPRERFVPPAYRALAFADTAIPLPHAQCMMTPQVEGRLLQALSIGSGERILEVGTGSGFLAACLARLGAEVVTLEIFADLAESARRTLHEVGVINVEVIASDVYQWEPPGPFNCIALTGSLPVYDRRFENWLAPEGQLFAIVGGPPVMDACLVERAGDGQFPRQSLFETVIPPLLNAVQAEPFVF